MPFTLANTDNFAVKQGVGTDVICTICGDDRTISGSTDAYSILSQGTITTSAVSKLAPASGHDFIVSSIVLTNPGASSRVVTLYLAKAGTTYDATSQWGPAITLGAGEAAEWRDGWTIYNSLGVVKAAASGQVVTRAYFAPAQALATTETYITNSNITVSALVANHILRWKVFVTKTGAGTAVPIISIYVGTNGSTADTKRFTTGTTVWTTALSAQTANADLMCLEVEVLCVGAGATGTLFGHMRMQRQNTALLGFAVAPNQEAHGLTGAIDISAANIQLGIAATSGTSAAWTVNQVLTEVITP